MDLGGDWPTAESATVDRSHPLIAWAGVNVEMLAIDTLEVQMAVSRCQVLAEVTKLLAGLDEGVRVTVAAERAILGGLRGVVLATVGAVALDLDRLHTLVIPLLSALFKNYWASYEARCTVI